MISQDQSEKLAAASNNQLIFAKVIHAVTFMSKIIFGITFIIYMFNILPVFLPKDEISSYWQLGVNEYFNTSGAPFPSQWINYINFGDYLAYAGIVLFGCIILMAYLTLIVPFIKDKDYIYLVFIISEVIVLSMVIINII